MDSFNDIPFRRPTTGKRFSTLSGLRSHMELGHSHHDEKNKLHSNDNDKPPTNVSSSYLWDLYSSETNKLESMILKQKENEWHNKRQREAAGGGGETVYRYDGGLLPRASRRHGNDPASPRGR